MPDRLQPALQNLTAQPPSSTKVIDFPNPTAASLLLPTGRVPVTASLYSQIDGSWLPSAATVTTAKFFGSVWCIGTPDVSLLMIEI
jgi:hypothetical protein